jgi:ribosomal protein S18 acetylase RimI-like enzyme
VEHHKYYKIIPFQERYKQDIFDVVITSFNSGKSWDDESRFYEGERLNEDFFNYIVTNKNNKIFLLINHADNKLVGTVEVSIMKECFWTPGVNDHYGDKGFIYISMLAVHPDYQSQGLGKHLMSFSEHYVERCKLSVNNDERANEIEKFLISQFNYDCKYVNDEFVNNNISALSKVEKIAVQFNNGRQSLINFYDKRNYKQIGCYQDSKDIIIDPKKTFITKVLRDFQFVFAERNIFEEM